MFKYCMTLWTSHDFLFFSYVNRRILTLTWITWLCNSTFSSWTAIRITYTKNGKKVTNRHLISVNWSHDLRRFLSRSFLSLPGCAGLRFTIDPLNALSCVTMFSKTTTRALEKIIHRCNYISNRRIHPFMSNFMVKFSIFLLPGGLLHWVTWGCCPAYTRWRGRCLFAPRWRCRWGRAASLCRTSGDTGSLHQT